MKTYRFMLTALLSLFIPGSVLAEPPALTVAKLPPLGESKVTATNDLGLWDDIFVPHDKDFAVLRRGEELFSLAMEPEAAPAKLTKVPAADKTQIAAGIAVGKRLWLFLNSRAATPCAVDVFTGEVARFEIPGLEITPTHAPGIQSRVFMPHLNAALLLVIGGDPETWPREGGHPIHFWMDLKSGKVVRLPTGWDINHFSADESLAVYAKPQEKEFERRPLQGVNMRTGELSDSLPDWRKNPAVPFNWHDKQRAKALTEKREGQGDNQFFAGLSVEGRVLPIDLKLTEVRYLQMAKVNDGFAGFRLRNEGSVGVQSTLWMFPLREPEKFAQAATGVIDFALLANGNAIVVTGSYGDRKKPMEAFFQPRGDKRLLDLLAGVERVPELEKEFVVLNFVEDRQSIHLVEGFGSRPGEALVLCNFDHTRFDLRALVPFGEKPLKDVRWRRSLLVGPDGRRAMTPLFREASPPEKLWLHNSGVLLTGTEVWHGPVDARERQVRLTQYTLQLPTAE